MIDVQVKGMDNKLHLFTIKKEDNISMLKQMIALQFNIKGQIDILKDLC